MLNLSEQKRRKELTSAFKKLGYDSMIKVPDGGESFLDEIDDVSDHKKSKSIFKVASNTDGNLLDDLQSREFDLLNMIFQKFNMSGASEQTK